MLPNVLGVKRRFINLRRWWRNRRQRRMVRRNLSRKVFRIIIHGEINYGEDPINKLMRLEIPSPRSHLGYHGSTASGDDRISHNHGSSSSDVSISHLWHSEIEDLGPGLRGARMAFVHPNLYILGGSFDQHGFARKLRCMNIFEPGPWKTIHSPMLSAKCDLKMFAVEGKLYVFGGHLEDHCNGPFSEVFDPATETWEAVSLDCDVIPRFCPFVALNSPLKKILVADIPDATLKALDLTTNDFESLFLSNTNEFVVYMMKMKSNVACSEDGSRIYWMSKFRKIVSFDWNLMKISQGPVVGLTDDDDFRRNAYSPYLFHLEEDFFCVFWHHPCNDSDALDDDDAEFVGDEIERTDVHCTIIRVKEYANEVSAFVVACFRIRMTGILAVYDVQCV